MVKRHPIDKSELKQLAFKLDYPINGHKAARQADLYGASDETILFLESIPGDLLDEDQLIDMAELAPADAAEVASLPMSFERAETAEEASE